MKKPSAAAAPPPFAVLLMSDRVAYVMQVLPIDRVYLDHKRRAWPSDGQMAETMRHLQENGWQSPLFIDPFGSILEGTLTYLAAKRLGIAQVPVVVIDWNDRPYGTKSKGAGMKVVALKNFTLAGETHATGEAFEVDQMRGEAWIAAGVVQKIVDKMETAAGDDDDVDPKVKRVIDEEDEV